MTRSLDVLWGAILDRINIDITSQQLAINCHVTTGSQENHYRLEFSALSEFRFFNSIPGPWKYSEITEIHTNRTPTGDTQVEIVFWSDGAGLVAVADSFLLDGEPITL